MAHIGGTFDLFDLTDRARVLAFQGTDVSGTGSAADDALVDVLVQRVSADIGQFLRRHIRRAARTEEYRVPRHSHVVQLSGVPVDEALTFEVRYSSDRSYPADPLSAAQYVLHPEGGWIELLMSTPYQPGYVQVVYTGGMAADLNDLDSKPEFRPIVHAATMQVAYLYARRDSLGGSLQLREGVKALSVGEYGLLEDVRRILGRYRRAA